MKASECKCIVCGKPAVAFWPIIDPDIPAEPYCCKCLDEAKAQAISNTMKVPIAIAKAIVKSRSQK